MLCSVAWHKRLYISEGQGLSALRICLGLVSRALDCVFADTSGGNDGSGWCKVHTHDDFETCPASVAFNKGVSARVCVTGERSPLS